MKKIGIIGGLSPVSTAEYLERLNTLVKNKLGGNHNARTLVEHVNFQTFCDLKAKEDWDTQAKLLIQAAQCLEAGKADFIILATNTMHKMADQITAAINIPFLHLADATADRILTQDLNKVALLGTRFTMEEDFYKDRLKQKGIETIVPDAHDIKEVSRIIYDELCHSVINDESRQKYQTVIQKLKNAGAQSVILGCTEITELIKQEDSVLPVFDTTQIHVETAFQTAFQ